MVEKNMNMHRRNSTKLSRGKSARNVAKKNSVVRGTTDKNVRKLKPTETNIVSKPLVRPTGTRVLATFKDENTSWKLQVDNLDTFLYPSLAHEEDSSNTTKESNDSTTMKWTGEALFQNESSEYADERNLRLNEDEAKKKIFDRKMALAERLLQLKERSTVLLEDTEDFFCSDDESGLETHHEHNLARSGSTRAIQRISVNSKDKKFQKDGNFLTSQEYYHDKDHIFQKWSNLKIAKQQSVHDHLQSGRDQHNSSNHVLSPRSAYFDKCLDQNVIPEPIYLKATQCGTLELPHFALGDQRAKILAHSLQSYSTLQNLSLSDNRLTKISIEPLLDALMSHPNLNTLDLSSNKIDAACCKSLANFVANTSIREINLSNTTIDDNGVKYLCASFEVHTKLRLVNLSRNSIGEKGGILVGDMISSSSCWIADLDISWNRITKKGAISIGVALRVNTSIKRLNVSMNRFGDDGGQQLAASVFENSFILELDCSNNNLGDISAICFAYAATINESLITLRLDSNPIGTYGIRAMVGGIVSGSTCTVTMTKVDIGNSKNYTAFDRFRPGREEPYDLNVGTSPYDYVICCELFRMVNRFRLAKVSDVVHTIGDQNTTISLEWCKTLKCMVSSQGKKKFIVPTTGRLKFTCSYTPRLPMSSNCIGDDELERLTRFLTHGLSTKDNPELMQVALMDVYLTAKQANMLFRIISKSLDRISLMSSLLVRIVNGEESYPFLNSNLKWNEQKQMVNLNGLFTARFNVKNPCGYWCLDLSDRKHHKLVEWFACINGSESKESRRTVHHGDTSQNGNWNNWRNEKFNGRSIVLDDDFFDNLPTHGILEFNYVPTSRPPLDAIPVTNDEIQEILDNLGAEPCPVYIASNKKNEVKYQLVMLHIALSGKYITCEQLSQLLFCFPKNFDSCRVKVIYAAFQSVIDLVNMPDILLQLTEIDRHTVIQGLGYLNLCSPIRPTMLYSCQFKYSDDRILIRSLLDIALNDSRDSIEVIAERSQHQLFELFAMASMPSLGTIVFQYSADVSNTQVPVARIAVLKNYLAASFGWKPNTIEKQNCRGSKI